VAEEPTIVVAPGGECATLDGTSLVEPMGLGVRTWGNAIDGDDVLVVGTYQSEGEVSRWLLDALPPVVVLPAADWDGWAVAQLQREVSREGAGQQVVLDRLLDVVLVDALRTAFSTSRLTVPAWFAAAADPVVGRVVQLMQAEPAEPWTLAGLAKAVGVSRPVLARRFHEAVGAPPMTFLTSWRMAVAADLLAAGPATVAEVAAAVGYGSPFTFSTAFKRVHGISPRDHRRRAAAVRAESADRADRWAPA
jgi:AraC-like DNA-binding protein